MGMQDDDCPPLIQYREKCVEFGSTKILTSNICRQFDTVCLQHIERVLRLFNGFGDIGQWEGGTEQEPAWVLFLDTGCCLVGLSHYFW